MTDPVVFPADQQAYLQHGAALMYLREVVDRAVATVLEQTYPGDTIRVGSVPYRVGTHEQGGESHLVLVRDRAILGHPTPTGPTLLLREYSGTVFHVATEDELITFARELSALRAAVVAMHQERTRRLQDAAERAKRALGETAGGEDESSAA